MRNFKDGFGTVRGYQQASMDPPVDMQTTSPSSPDHNTQQKSNADMFKVSRFDPLSDPFDVKNLVTVKDLFHARVHFGHKTGKWNYQIKPYIYGIRNDIHIFNLNTTLMNLQRALNIAGHIAYQHGIILFVNERPQFEALTQFTARKCEEYLVTNWVPGTLCNSYMLLKTLRLPDLVIFFSMIRSKSAVKEANTAGIPTIGVVDSDCNPNHVLYPIPGNDDSYQAINLYSELFCEVILRAKQLRQRDEEEARQKAEIEALEKRAAEKERITALDVELDSIYGKNIIR